MLCNFHSVPTKPWIPHQNTATQVGKNLWQKPVIISSRTYINNPKEYPNSIGGVWVRHWCQQLKEKNTSSSKFGHLDLFFFQFWGMVKQNGHIPSTLKIFVGNHQRSFPSPSLLPSSHRLLQSLAGIREAWASWPNHQAARQLDETMGFRVWEKWQSFHSFQLSALRIVEISKPKFFFHKNLMSVVRIVCQKNLVSRL